MFIFEVAQLSLCHHQIWKKICLYNHLILKLNKNIVQQIVYWHDVNSIIKGREGAFLHHKFVLVIHRTINVNINFSNGNEFSPFYVDYVFPLPLTKLIPDLTMSKTASFLSETGTVCPLKAPVGLMVYLLLILLVISVVFVALLVSVLCLVSNVAFFCESSILDWPLGVLKCFFIYRYTHIFDSEIKQ